MRCHLRKWYLRNGRFSPSSSKFVRPCGTPRFPFGFRQKISVRRNFLPETEGKTLRKRRDGRKRDSEGENCDRRSACATRKRTVREPLFMPYPGMRPLSSPAVVKALLLPLHCICELFRLYPRQPVLPALSLVERLVATGGVTQTFPDMEDHSGKYTVHLYIEPIITE